MPIKIAFILLLALISFNWMSSQNDTLKKKLIIIEHADFIDKNENEAPGAIVFTGNVKIRHNGVKINCHKAYQFKSDNYVKAFGEVHLNQGDTLFLDSNYAEYNGDESLAVAIGEVKLNSPKSELTTDTIYFDRLKQLAYYNSFGTIKDSENTLTSLSGTYHANEKRYEFKKRVKVISPKSIIETNHLNYYEESGHAYVYGPSTITGEKDKIYTENGFYDTKNNIGKLKKKGVIESDGKIIKGDDLFYDQEKSYSRAINNVEVIDTINNLIASGHFAELFRNKTTKSDSIVLTKKALVSSITKEKDTFHLHGKKIILTGTKENRLTKAFNDVRFIKQNMSGKCDSLVSTESNGLTQLIGQPIIWYQNAQLTGDLMHLIQKKQNNSKTLDSLKVLGNAFMIEKDTLGDGYNQVKGANLYGKFEENQLKTATFIKNTEMIYFLYTEDNKFIGIDKKVCSKIALAFEQNQVDQITFYKDSDAQTYPDKDLPKNARKLKGFIWKENQRIHSIEDLFSTQENQIDQQVKQSQNKRDQESSIPLKPKTPERKNKPNSPNDSNNKSP